MGKKRAYITDCLIEAICKLEKEKEELEEELARMIWLANHYQRKLRKLQQNKLDVPKCRVEPKIKIEFPIDTEDSEREVEFVECKIINSADYDVKAI